MELKKHWVLIHVSFSVLIHVSSAEEGLCIYNRHYRYITCNNNWYIDWSQTSTVANNDSLTQVWMSHLYLGDISRCKIILKIYIILKCIYRGWALDFRGNFMTGTPKSETGWMVSWNNTSINTNFRRAFCKMSSLKSMHRDL